MQRERIKILYLLRGLPGAGKSTLASTIDGLKFEADMYFIDKDGNYNYDPKEIQSANNWCHNSVMDVMEKSAKSENDKYDRIIVSNNFIIEKELEPYYKVAKRYGYNVFSIIVENRHNENSQSPDFEIKSLAKRFEVKLI